MSVERINLIGVPVDICSPENLENEILELLAHPGTKQIVLLSIWDLLKARHKGEFSECIKNANLIIPISKSIIKGARFLKLPVPERYNPFDVVIQILSILESHYKTLYMMGSNKKILRKAESNVASTFPGLRIVGRCVGYYNKNLEDDIVQAIFKAQPSLVLVSDGIKEKNNWGWKRRNRFSSSIFLYYKDAFAIFAKKIKRVNQNVFERGHEIFFEILRNPLKTFLIFPYMWYIITLLYKKITKSGK